MTNPKHELTPAAAWALLETEGVEALLAALEASVDIAVYELLERCADPPSARVH